MGFATRSMEREMSSAFLASTKNEKPMTIGRLRYEAPRVMSNTMLERLALACTGIDPDEGGCVGDKGLGTCTQGCSSS